MVLWQADRQVPRGQDPLLPTEGPVAALGSWAGTSPFSGVVPPNPHPMAAGWTQTLCPPALTWGSQPHSHSTSWGSRRVLHGLLGRQGQGTCPAGGLQHPPHALPTPSPRGTPRHPWAHLACSGTAPLGPTGSPWRGRHSAAGSPCGLGASSGPETSPAQPASAHGRGSGRSSGPAAQDTAPPVTSDPGGQAQPPPIVTGTLVGGTSTHGALRTNLTVPRKLDTGSQARRTCRGA